MTIKANLSGILEDLQEYIDGLESEKEELEGDVAWLNREIRDLEAQYRALGLRNPDSYSLAELSEIKAAIERITSPVTVR